MVLWSGSPAPTARAQHFGRSGEDERARLKRAARALGALAGESPEAKPASPAAAAAPEIAREVGLVREQAQRVRGGRFRVLLGRFSSV